MSQRRLLAAGTAIGIGMGGFVDGILFHQILQLHNMMSNRLPPTTLVNAEINMFWDGLFHAFTWLMTAVGISLLWQAVLRPSAPLSTRTLIGSVVLGWGIFNLVEGLLDHQILQIHHVHEYGNHLLWDMVFLASGGLLIGIGWALVRAARAEMRRVDAGSEDHAAGRAIPGR